MYYSSLVMADEWEEEYSQYESSGKSFGRGNYIQNDSTGTTAVEETNSGWEEDTCQEGSNQISSQENGGDNDYRSNMNGGGNRYERGRGDRGRGGRGGRGGTRGGGASGGGFRRNDDNRNGGGYRDGGYKDSGNRDGGYRDSGNREGGYRDNGNRDGGYRDNGNRDGGYRDNGNRDGGFKEGGYKRDGQRNGGFGGRHDRFNDGDNDDRENSRGGFRGGRGGRGGGGERGGSRGGRGAGGRGGENGYNNDRRGDRNGSGDEDKTAKDKPRELYIPPDPTEDETEIFNSGISSGINFDKYDKIPVNVSSGAPPAISSFEESGMRKFVLDNIKKSGYERPTPIQKNAIPIIMNKMDLMACAQTGSGKTAAFLLPIVHVLLEENKDLVVGRPHCFVISPTRELAIQIFNEARKFALGSYLKIQVVYGGTAVKHQGNNLARGSHIVVCTPGRMLDFVEKEMLSFEDVRFMVLDEADRMLDLGFMPSVEKVMNHPSMSAPDKRQTLMFSATFPEEIQRLAGQFLNNYIFLAIGIVGGACADVEQTFYKLTRFEKRQKLTQILEESISEGGIMVFVETKRNADYLASLLSETKFPTTSIHGDRLQREREEALADFKSGKMGVLIATSVAARGLDIKHVAHVINYDLPKSIDEYVHRIGRTGRVGNCGKATSFYDPDQDAGLASDLVKILKQANQPVPDFLESMSGGGGGGGGYRNNKFGGRDVRRTKNVEVNENAGYISASTAPEAQEPEELW